MREQPIDLASLIPNGKVDAAMIDGVLHMTTTRSIHDVGYNIRRDKITSYLSLPGQYSLPMQIDMTLKIDSPEMLLLIGQGHISIGSPWMENRRIEDLAEPTGKPKMYDNSIPLNQFVDITLLLNRKAMQIRINGEERYYSTKERYMKSSRFQAQNTTGVDIGITCTKRAQLIIQSLYITTHEADVPLARGLHADGQTALQQDLLPPIKPTFESCIDALPEPIQHELYETDRFLKTLKHVKFKRVIEKHGNKITYVAPNEGVSYALYLSGNIMHHSLQWYIVTNSKPELWHRKSNLMEETLAAIRQSSPDLADRIFTNLNECIGCRDRCLVRTPYTYQSQTKLTCHGQVFFKMHLPDFQDVRDFFAGLNMLVEKDKLTQ